VLQISARIVRALPARRALPAAFIAVLAAAATLACVHEMSSARIAPGTAPAPGELWTPPPEEKPAPSLPPPAIAPDLIESAQNWGLAELIDLALRNNPETKGAWASARAAAAELGRVKGSYYPTVDVEATLSRSKRSRPPTAYSPDPAAPVTSANQFVPVAPVTSANPSLVIDYLLLDFGGRRASVEEARQALIAADWANNAMIQEMILRVEQAYYLYLYSRDLQQAQQASVKEAQASLEAATQRHDAGLATIADVLQAKTLVSQAQLALLGTEGQIQTLRGALATSVGLPANTPYDVKPLPEALPLQPVTEEVDRLIGEAAAKRPDLAAARARVLEAEARIEKADAADRPTLNTSVSAGRDFYLAPSSSEQNVYSGALLLTIPIFNGFAYQYDLMKAKAEADLARAERETLEQAVISQVWSSYHNLKTAAKKIETSADLLESAQKSFEVVSARYKAGVSNIIDVLNAETTLFLARAARAQARTDWLLSIAQLAHDTGTLLPPAEQAEKGSP